MSYGQEVNYWLKYSTGQVPAHLFNATVCDIMKGHFTFVSCTLRQIKKNKLAGTSLKQYTIKFPQQT